MKNRSLLLWTLIISTSMSGMKRQLEIQPAPTTLITLDNDCFRHICMHIEPNWNNWKPNSKTLGSAANNSQKLRSAANSIESLTRVSKGFNKFFSPTRIAELLQVNDTNKNLFLLRASQAGIPCLVHYAITSGADVNYDKKNEFQPLMSAVMNKNYRCAELLLNAKASTTQSTQHFPVYLQPIQFATEAGDLKMVTLLLNFKADPNTTTPLYSDPAISQSTLDIALNKRHISIAKLLIEKGAIAHKRDKLKLQELQATLKPRQKWIANKQISRSKKNMLRCPDL